MRSLLRRLERKAQHHAVFIRQRDGTTKAFPWMYVQGELYLMKCNRALGVEPHTSPFTDALASATDESRREVLALAEGGYYSDMDEPADGEPEDLSEQARDS